MQTSASQNIDKQIFIYIVDVHTCLLKLYYEELQSASAQIFNPYFAVLHFMFTGNGNTIYTQILVKI